VRFPVHFGSPILTNSVELYHSELQVMLVLRTSTLHCHKLKHGIDQSSRNVWKFSCSLLCLLRQVSIHCTTPHTVDQPCASTYQGQHRRLGFKPTIPVFEGVKAFRATNCAAKFRSYLKENTQRLHYRPTD
jgi:hypothetical protein